MLRAVASDTASLLRSRAGFKSSCWPTSGPLTPQLAWLTPADDVEVTGVVIRQFGPMFPGVRCQVSSAVL